MSLEPLAKPVEILLVEDNPGDVRLTREAFRDARVSNRLHTVSDGVEALSFLAREGEYRDAPLPDLILLDLNLPRKDGREVLAKVKADERLRSIPVVVMTTSKADEDVVRAYGLHANCYIVKPLDFDRFVDVIRTIESFWLCIVRLPAAA